jgi:hypothetical protein
MKLKKLSKKLKDKYGFIVVTELIAGPGFDFVGITLPQNLALEHTSSILNYLFRKDHT